jgi:hypothetical protein
MRVKDLTGAELDYWVAKANGDLRDSFVPTRDVEIDPELFAKVRKEKHHYSTNWAHGGPIIERQRIGLAAYEDGTWGGYTFDHAAGQLALDYEGPTALVAAMRCYVASKFGVEVPAE